MKTIELLRLVGGVLRACRAAGVRMDDVRWIGLLNDYERMRERGEKMTWIVATLSDRYRVSERTVYALVKRMKRECKVRAV